VGRQTNFSLIAGSLTLAFLAIVLTGCGGQTYGEDDVRRAFSRTGLVLSADTGLGRRVNEPDVATFAGDGGSFGVFLFPSDGRAEDYERELDRQERAHPQFELSMGRRGNVVVLNLEDPRPIVRRRIARALVALDKLG
jgi:hypothetical protein